MQMECRPDQEQAFKSVWGKPADARVRADGIVECLNVAKGRRFCRVARREMQINAFAFEAGEEIFRHSIVVGVTFAGHALPKLIVFQSLAISGGGVLQAAVGMENQVGLGFLIAHRHFERREGQPSVDAVPKGYPTTFFRHRSLTIARPSLAGGDAGYVADPCFVWPREFEIAF